MRRVGRPVRCCAAHDGDRSRAHRALRRCDGGGRRDGRRTQRLCRDERRGAAALSGGGQRSGPASGPRLVPDRRAQWRHQIADFARTHHVVAVDHRGHGESDKPDHGYRVARLSTDVHQLVHALDLTEVVWVAHSMGCALAWSYWDMFGGDRLSRLVLFDEPAVLLRQPNWPDDLAERLGALYVLGADRRTSSPDCADRRATPRR